MHQPASLTSSQRPLLSRIRRSAVPAPNKTASASLRFISFRSLSASSRKGADTAIRGEYPSWPAFLGTLFVAGCVSGPLLDSIHSRVRLQIYDSLPIDVLSFHSSVWVAPLLGAFYVVLGILHPVLDVRFEGSQTPKLRNISWGKVALGVGTLAALLQTSAVLYENDTPYLAIHVVLAILSAGNWWVFDRSKQGLLLALVCALGAPIAELPILNWFGWWHYTRPDFLGLPSWVFWCYFFYTPHLGNFARKLWIDCRD